MLRWQEELIVLGIFTLGTFLFSMRIFRMIDKRETEIQRRTEQLAALNEAALSLTKELDISVVLEKVVNLSRELVNAKYGALGVLDESGESVEQLITSGITQEQRALVGALPNDHGLLGIMIKEGQPLSIPEITEDPRSVGFPPNHPAMHSVLGVPIRSKGKVIGNLYLTDKIPQSSNSGADYTVFSEQDQQILEMFSTQAAIAIENAKLYRQSQQLAILQERDRFGMDLHDGIMQSIYAIGLMLEESQHQIKSEPEVVSKVILRATQGLNDVISDIRNYILDLRPQRFQGLDLQSGLNELTRELRVNTFVNVQLHTGVLEHLSLLPDQTAEILHIAKEALTNVRRHAHASNVNISLKCDSTNLFLTIEDDGIGIDPDVADKTMGNGLRNMSDRASALGGEVYVEPCDTGGTRVLMRIPLIEKPERQ
ncbi:MAG: GAF domain-containing sensor histidine kinase [Anaerolineales bacterium]|nr:GAF domain-containing sensor histidine kinase [Anaerolineales bacterium]